MPGLRRARGRPPDGPLGSKSLRLCVIYFSAPETFRAGVEPR
jgi:hypothetical protein